MNKDNHLMFEAYVSKFFKSEPFNSEDCEDRAGEVNWHQKVQRNDHVEHGRRAAKWELESGKKAHNPHHLDSDEGREWQFGYNEERGIKKTEEDSEEDLGPEPDQVQDYTNAVVDIKRVASKVAGCITDKNTDTSFNKDSVSGITASSENAQFTVTDDDGRVFKVTVELAHPNESEEVTEKVRGVTKKQQALAGAVCNKQIGKHKGNAAKFKSCMKGVEKSQVKKKK